MNIMLAVTNISVANGGVSTHIVDMCRELLRRKHRVVLVTDPSNCDYSTDIDDFYHVGRFKFIPISMSGIQMSAFRFFRIARAFTKIVRQEKIDVMHMHSQSLCVVGAFVKIATGTPYIWTNHIDEICKPELFKKILQILRFPIISVSEELKELLVNQYSVCEERVSVVNNGIDLGRFLPISSKELGEMSNQFNCGGKYVIGLLARMSYGKGHIFLLRAVNELQSEYGLSNLKILIAGKVHDNEVKYRDDLVFYAKEHNIDVEFVGFQKPRDFFGICNVSVLPSIYEGFALTVIESLAMGCPAIRSDTPGWTALKDFTLVFHKKQSRELAQELLYAYTHQGLMKEMGLKGKSAVQAHFTIENQVEQTLTIYRNIVGKSQEISQK